ERRRPKRRTPPRTQRGKRQSPTMARIACARRCALVESPMWRSPVVDSPLRVLIVDDEAPARRRLRELLDDCTGALPLSVVGERQHGREALDLLQPAPAELVLTDIHMPDMDGIELA